MVPRRPPRFAMAPRGDTGCGEGRIAHRSARWMGYARRMLDFSAVKSVEFVPDDESRAWLAEGLGELAARLGAPAAAPRIVADSSIAKPRDLDRLFELICGVQAEVGQRDVEFALVEIQPGQRPVPHG